MKKVVISLLTAISVLFFISCGSKPAAEETKPEAPVVEATTDNPESTVTDVEAPSDLSGVDAIIAEINDARNLAIEAGAEDLAPEQLQALDDLYNGFKEDPSSLGENSKMLLKGYKLLADYCKAVEARDEIEENEFEEYAQADYDKGVECLEAVEAAYESGDFNNDKVFDQAAEAYSRFNTVLTVAYKKLAKAERELAYEAKKKADSVKAGVARRDEYKEAADTFQKGDASYSMQNPKRALELYEEAKESFLDLYEDVAEKRAAAQAAIEAAKQRVAESAKFAEEADVKAPITEQIDGIEDEDAVLLDEDEYDDPEDAEADIAEDIDDEEEEEE